MIRIEDLSISYGNIKALQNVSMQVDDGEWVLMSGPSGCGKSTLARAIAGVIPHAIQATMEGRIQVNGIDTQQKNIAELSQHVGMVFQNPGSQLFHLKVKDEIAFGPRNLGLDEDEVQRRTAWVLEAVGIEELQDRRPADLSGGQKQCVAIAAVLAMRPRILVLDEPAASLDLPNTYKVMETLKKLRDHYKITIIMIEHRLSAFIQSVDRVLLLDEGALVVDGTPKDIFEDWQRCLELGLRRPADLPMTPWRGLIQPNGVKDREEKPLLSLEGISAGYNGKEIIRNINLSIFPRDFLALVGANGAGKSTLALVAAGLLKPRNGKVRFLGGGRPKPGLEVALLFQNAADQLFTDSVEEEVSFGPDNYHRWEEQAHQQTLIKADLIRLRERRPMLLSVGQQQRTALAACLSLRPKLVILDEPTLGQDWNHLQRLMDFLKALNQEGSAVLLISHDYKIVHRYANRMMLMENGKIKVEGTLHNKQEEKHNEV